MSRNKYPEETVNLILDVAYKLFLEKGYDKTTIQDIIDNMGGLLKVHYIIILRAKKTYFLA